MNSVCVKFLTITTAHRVANELGLALKTSRLPSAIEELAFCVTDSEYFKSDPKAENNRALKTSRL
jgi:hypothetical protein